MTVVQDIQAKLADLQSSVEGETDLTTSVVTLLNGQTALLNDLKKQLADAINAGADPQQLQAVVDALSTITATNTRNAEAIAAAVVQNTPAAGQRGATRSNT